MVRDLNSKVDCTPVLTASFIPPNEHTGSFIYYRAQDARECCWNLLELVHGDLDPEEGSEEKGDAHIPLSIQEAGTVGELRVLKDAAFADDSKPVTIMALHVAGSPELYFWTTRNASLIIDQLEQREVIVATQDFSLGNGSPYAHHQLYLVLQLSFEMAVKIDDSDEYKAASRLSHLDELLPARPESALELVRTAQYYRSKPVRRSLNDDRYVNELEDWEVFVAERANLCAAEYLEIRRRYFDRFSRDVGEYRREHGLAADDHIQPYKDYKNKVDFMNAIRSWGWGRRRLLVQAWIELDMLDENKF